KRIHPQLSIGRRGEDYVATISWIIDNINVRHEDVTMLNAALLLHDYQLYSVENINEVYLVEEFLPDGEFVIPADKWNDFLQKDVLEWSQVVHVNFDEDLVEHVDKIKPSLHLYLREREQMLLLQPVFSYQDVEIRWGFFGDVIQPHKGIVKIISRNEQAEQEFVHLLANLHSDIQANRKEHFFYLPATSVLANNWFFRFVEIMKEWNVELFGFEGLKNLRINTH